MRFLIIINLLLVLSCRSQDTLTIIVEDKFCGEIIFMEKDSWPENDVVKPDTNNYVVINKTKLKSFKKIKLIRGGKDCTNLLVPHKFGGSINWGNNPEDYFYYYSLFVMCDVEYSNSENFEYWQNKFNLNTNTKGERLRIYWVELMRQ